MKRPLSVVVLTSLAVLLIGPIPNSLARPPGERLPAGRTGTVPKAIEAIEAAGPASAAYGTGTVVHADALRADKNALANLDVAFSGAAFSSAPTASEITNEVQRIVAPKLDPKKAFGRGTGLELGLGSTPAPLIGQLSEAAAPPSYDEPVHNVIGPLGIPRILTAELLRSQAQSRAVDGCVLGRDQAFGLGSVLDLEVLGGLLATVARPPLREISQSSSTTRIVEGSTDDRLALKSETRQTIAPVTFFKGAPIQFTVEVLGEWALRAVADGADASVHYGPRIYHPETPIVRILGARGEVLGQLTTQMLLTRQGLKIEIPGVAELAVGEPPRMVDSYDGTGAMVTPTMAAAAVDVVRVRLLESDLADVRIGHMEAAVAVPANGVQCPGLTVEHEVDKPTVTPGDEFQYTIEVTNPHDCVLTKVNLVDTLTIPAGVKLEVGSVTPPGGQVAAGLTGADVDALATFPDIGPIGPGETKTVTIKVNVPLGSAPGALKALAVATGICPAEVVPSTDVHGPGRPGTPGVGDIPVRGEDSVTGPEVAAVGGPLCTVPSVSGLTPEGAKEKLVKAGCDLGDVTTDTTGKPGEPGTITIQNPPAGDKVPLETEVDVVIAPPAQGSMLFPAGIGSQATAGPAPRESVAGETATRTPTEVGAGPTLVRTGGVAYAGLALWLLVMGLSALLASSNWLWRLARRPTS